MHYTFDADTCAVISAAEYLRHFPGRGRTIHLPHLNYAFYGISDCLCLGEEKQAVAPLHNGALPLVFSDAVPFLANEALLPGIVTSALAAMRTSQPLEEAVPLYPPGMGNFWHFTTESLPKVLALESAGYTGPYIVPKDVLARPDGFAAQSLALFNIGPERLLPAGPVYRIKRLMLPERLNGFDLSENMALAGLLRDRLLEAVGTEPGTRRVYIRRVGRRKIANEEALLALLHEFDFTTLTPEDLTVREQWRFMTNVECSIMAHGANTTLTLLQRPRSGFVELFSNNYISYTNMHAVRLLRLRYIPLVEELELSTYPGDQTPLANFLAQGYTADIRIHPPDLRILLETLFS